MIVGAFQCGHTTLFDSLLFCEEMTCGISTDQRAMAAVQEEKCIHSVAGD